MSALGEILRGALEQRASSGARGLMKPGKAPLMERLAFLLSTGRDERNYAIGRYLDTRRTGGRFANGRRRTGDYSGVYSGSDEAASLVPEAPQEPWPSFGEHTSAWSIPDNLAEVEAGSTQRSLRLPRANNENGGDITWEPEGDSWRIRGSYLNPQIRRQGNGIKLYEALLELARERGVPNILSDNINLSRDAQNIYESLGRRGYNVTEAQLPNGLTQYSVATQKMTGREAQLARAEAMGFDTSRVLYHGTQSDVESFRPSSNSGGTGRATYGPGVYVSSTPSRANDYAGIHALNREGGNVIPLYARRGSFRPTIGKEGRIVDPRDVRSIFAQFDPAKANSSDLLAGLAIGAPAAALTLREALRGRMMGEA